MQIHEITLKPITEASMMSALAGGIAKAAASQFTTSTLGVDPNVERYGGSGASGTDARARGAMKINQQAAGLLGQQMGKAWQVAVQNFMKTHVDATKNPLINMKNANPADAERLRQELNNMIVSATGITGTTLDAWPASIKTGDVSDTQEAKLIVDQIKKLEEVIWKETISPTDAQGKARVQAFTNLGTAIAQAQNVNTFTQNQLTTGKPTSRIKFDERTGKFTYDGRPYDDTNPAHRAAMTDFNKNRPA